MSTLNCAFYSWLILKSLALLKVSQSKSYLTNLMFLFSSVNKSSSISSEELIPLVFLSFKGLSEQSSQREIDSLSFKS